jgi:hypothetical protein
VAAASQNGVDHRNSAIDNRRFEREGPSMHERSIALSKKGTRYYHRTKQRLALANRKV